MADEKPEVILVEKKLLDEANQALAKLKEENEALEAKNTELSNHSMTLQIRIAKAKVVLGESV